MLRYLHIASEEWPAEDGDELSTRAPGRSVARPAYASMLRQQVLAHAAAWAEASGTPCTLTTGRGAALLFEEDSEGRHGNFFPASYRRILSRPEWRRRLDKVHTTARRITTDHGSRRELDTAISSDALLMSVLCHPRVLKEPSCALRRLLGLHNPRRLQFGYTPRIPLNAGHIERTEVDLRIEDADGDLLLEAKLTESDFQTTKRPWFERYRDAETVFDIDALPASNGRLLHYQLLRACLCAQAREDRRYGVVCDARRPDLIDAWYAVLQRVRPMELRNRLLVVTWQEIAAALPAALQRWLAAKYGIEPA